MTYLNIWRAWSEADRSKRWCGAHFLNYRNLLRAADIRRQLEFALRCAAAGNAQCLTADLPLASPHAPGLPMAAFQACTGCMAMVLPRVRRR